MERTEKNIKMLTEALYRYKIEFNKAAQVSGATARYLSQHSVLWGAIDNDADAFNPLDWFGVCAGLSIEWIKARVRGEDLLAKLATARNEVFSIKRGERKMLPQLARDITASQLQQKNLAAALSPFCLPAGGSTECGFPFAKIRSALKSEGYYVISSGTHAMAAQRRESSIDFYDPNVGELSGTSTEALVTYLQNAVVASCEASGTSKEAAKKKVMTVHGFSVLKK